MAVVIRLARIGKKHSPIYRITVADSRRYVTGKFLEVLGVYNPEARGKAKPITLDIEKYEAWIKKGAQPSDRVKSVFRLAQKG